MPDAPASVLAEPSAGSSPTAPPAVLAEASAGSSPTAPATVLAEAAAGGASAASITSANTLTEDAESTTCPVLYENGTINGKPFYSGPNGWACYWTAGDKWEVTYISATFTWYQSQSADDVATPDLATFDAPTLGSGTPDFSLAAASLTAPDSILAEPSAGSPPTAPASVLA